MTNSAMGGGMKAHKFPSRVSDSKIYRKRTTTEQSSEKYDETRKIHVIQFALPSKFWQR